MAVVLVAVAALMARPAPAAEGGAIDPAELDGAIRSTLSQRAFSWRLPRVRPEEAAALEARPWLVRAVQWVGQALMRALRTMDRAMAALHRWWERVFGTPSGDPARLRETEWNWRTRVRVLLFAALVLAVAGLAILLYRLRRARRARVIPTPDTVPLQPEPPPDDAPADALPPDEWSALAREAFEMRDYRLAVRACTMASLARLGRAGRLTLARHKSNSEYRRELHRRAHDLPDVLQAFDQLLAVFERCWYGTDAATEAIAQRAFHFDSLVTRADEDTGGGAT